MSLDLMGLFKDLMAAMGSSGDVSANTPHHPAEGGSGGLLGGFDSKGYLDLPQAPRDPEASGMDVRSRNAEAQEDVYGDTRTSAKVAAALTGDEDRSAFVASLLANAPKAPSLNMSQAALPEYQRQKREQLATTLKQLIGG